MHAAAWGAQLAKGEGEPRVYVVEPTGPLEDDPNVTDQRFPGNPTRSDRTLEPVRVVRELEDWPRHSEESVRAMRASLAALVESGDGRIIDRPTGGADGPTRAAGFGLDPVDLRDRAGSSPGSPGPDGASSPVRAAVERSRRSRPGTSADDRGGPPSGAATT